MPDEMFYRSYYIVQVLSDGLLVEGRAQNTYNWNSPEKIGDPFCLVHHPSQTNFVDGQEIHFLALKVGNYQYTDVLGSAHTVPKYDYGIPFDPQQVAAAIAAERRRTNQSSIRTNAPNARSPQTNAITMP